MNIYVGRVAASIKEEDLRKEFQRYGEVLDIRVARGFAFVEMPDDDKANMAIKRLDGKEMNGRKISVKKSEPVTDDVALWRRIIRALAGGGI